MTTDFKQHIDELFDRLERAALIKAKPVLGVEEAAAFTGYTVKGIYTLTSEKRIPHYKRNGKVYFKKDDLVDWMTETKVLTEQEIQNKAVTYTATRQFPKL